VGFVVIRSFQTFLVSAHGRGVEIQFHFVDAPLQKMYLRA
jgi:hypothetical protein